MTLTDEVIGWDICVYCGKTYEVYAAYISERRKYCVHTENGLRILYGLIFIRKETR